MEIIAEGAEAIIYKLDENTILKRRLEKTYRLKEIDDKLRKFRNKREYKVLTKLQELKINAPKPIKIYDKETQFEMELINGNTLKNVLNQELLNEAFNNIINLHKNNITHGDLTTLNMIEKEKQVFLIDFGLADFTNKIEDKAVDLNLFFTCIKNEHPKFFNEKDRLTNIYKKQINRGEEIIKRLINIEHRGRNK